MEPHHNNNQPPGVGGAPPIWGGTRAGSRRWPTHDAAHPGARVQQPPSRPRSVPPPQAPAPALDGTSSSSTGVLQLRPGANVCGAAVGGASLTAASSGDSSSTRSYTLQSQLHQGPRSAVWRAEDSSSQAPVVLKVLSTSSAKQHAAAMHELAVLQQLAPPAGQQPDGPAGAAAARTSSHLVQLLDALLVLQHSHKPRATSAKGSASPPLDDQGASPDGAAAAAVVLVLSPLHQSLAWVLHWVQQRHGRAGLPPSAVRSLAHQLLSGLAELHDGQSLVHRDVKPSNVLLQQPFVVRTRKNLMRNMSLQELTSAQWSLADMGSAGRLLPPPPSPAQLQEGSAPAGRQRSWLQSLWEGWQQQRQHGSGGAAVATDTPSQQRWQVAAGDVPGYETAPYSPPEAILHLPATAAYDIWSAACLIYEAATGRVLFPLEAAAAERQSILSRSRQQSRSAAGTAGSSEADADRGTQLDGLHLVMVRGVSGRPPAQLLARSSVAEELYADTAAGVLWLSDEEEEGWPSPGAAEALQRAWRPRFCRPLLHHLMARRSMPLEQAVELAELLEPMLAWEPDQRPTAAQLLQHKYFQPLRCSEGVVR